MGKYVIILEDGNYGDKSLKLSTSTDIKEEYDNKLCELGLIFTDVIKAFLGNDRAMLYRFIIFLLMIDKIDVKDLILYIKANIDNGKIEQNDFELVVNEFNKYKAPIISNDGGNHGGH